MAVCALPGCRTQDPIRSSPGAGWRPMISLFVPPVESGPRYRHRVARGETLAEIADRYAVDLVSLATENSLALGAGLQPGVELTLPADARVVHVVRRGETLSHLAAWYRLPVERIAEVNAIDDPRALHVGAEVWIPPGAGQVPMATPRLVAAPTTADGTSLVAAERLVAEGEANYRDAAFRAALRDALASQSLSADLPATAARDHLVARAALLEGMAQTALGDTAAAQRAFEKALRSDAELHLDPRTTSPKILRAFETARAAVVPASDGGPVPREP